MEVGDEMKSLENPQAGVDGVRFGSACAVVGCPRTVVVVVVPSFAEQQRGDRPVVAAVVGCVEVPVAADAV
jgi:hypothetical protein